MVAVRPEVPTLSELKGSAAIHDRQLTNFKFRQLPRGRHVGTGNLHRVDAGVSSLSDDLRFDRWRVMFPGRSRGN